MKEGRVSPRSARRTRRTGGRAQDAHVDDPYQRTAKPRGPSVCPQCRAVYEEGRWRWGLPPVGAAEFPCPACRRANDRYPAGIVTLSGDYLTQPQHLSEILNLAHRQEELEKAEHPLNRVMDVETREKEVVITTTDIHLPRRIGEAVQHAHRGDLDFQYDDDAYFVRVDWRRDDTGA